MNDTDTKELLERLKKRYTENNLKKLDWIVCPVTARTEGRDTVLTVSEVALLADLHNAFPTLLSLAYRTEAAERELAEAREKIEELEQKLNQAVSPQKRSFYECGKTLHACEVHDHLMGDGRCSCHNEDNQNPNYKPLPTYVELEATISTQAAEIQRLRDALLKVKEDSQYPFRGERVQSTIDEALKPQPEGQSHE